MSVRTDVVLQPQVRVQGGGGTSPLGGKNAELVAPEAKAAAKLAGDASRVGTAELRAQGSTPALGGPPAGAPLGAALQPDQAHLRSGATGARVEALQRILNLQGQQPPLETDGKFGTKTKAAVEAFQESLGLKRDGIAGPNTLRAAQAIEALASASCTGDRAAAEAHLALAEQAIQAIPADQRGRLTERLAAARAQLPTQEGVAPPVKAEGNTVAKTTVEQDRQQLMLVAEEEARDGSDAIVSMVEDPNTFNRLGAPALEQMVANLSDDGIKSEREAQAAGQMMGRLLKLNPSPENFERLTGSYESFMDRKGDTLVNQALSQVSDPELVQFPPTTLTGMRDKLASGSVSELDQTNMDRIDGALRTQGGLTGPDLVGPLTPGQSQARDAAQVALISAADDQAPWLGGSDAIIAEVTRDPSTLMRLSPAGLEAAYSRLADDGIKGEREAEVAGQLLGRLAVAQPERFAELRGQYQSAFDRKADTLAEQAVGVMTDRELVQLAKTHPSVAQELYEAMDSGWTTGSEQAAMDRIVAAQRHVRLEG